MSFRTVTDPTYIPNYRPGGVPIRQTVKPCKKPGCSNTFVGAKHPQTLRRLQRDGEVSRQERKEI